MNVKQDLPEIPSLMDHVRDGVMCSLAQKERDRWAKAGESPIDALLS